MSDPVLRLRGGENCPFYRSRETQADLLSSLAADAVEQAITEEGLPPDRVQVETRYSQGRTEPHTAFGEVRVYDRYADDE